MDLTNTVLLSLSSRHYLSISHLSTAALFSQRAAKLEPNLKLGEPASEEGVREHHACVITSIMSSVAFLEAVINELWADCGETYSRVTADKIPNRHIMATLWGKSPLKRSTMLEKFELALELNTKQPLSKNTYPYQDVKLLIELRNALIHYEPETTVDFLGDPDSKRKEHKFEKKFHGKFKLNTLTGAGNSFYPEKLLGAGCACWAVISAVEFATIFFNNLGISSRHEELRKAFNI